VTNVKKISNNVLFIKKKRGIQNIKQHNCFQHRIRNAENQHIRMISERS